MNNPPVTIGVILYRNEKYLPLSLESLAAQDYPNLEIRLRDQSPQGEAAAFIEKNLPGILPRVALERGENKMHSGGHNALIAAMKGEYYFCCSNDMWYPQDFVSRMVAEMEKPENAKYGSATCKLMVWDFENDLKTDVIDSCGIVGDRAHFFTDLGQGQKDRGQHDSRREIFGPSGALAVFRKTALADLEGPFDEMLHYKNDVDLAYRLQWAGHRSLFVPGVKVWHDRQAKSIPSQIPLLSVLKSRPDKSAWVKENSLLGQLVMIRKNASPAFSFGTKFRTWLRRVQTAVYALYMEPHLIRVYRQFRGLRTEVDQKSARMKRVATPAAIEKLLS